MHPRAVINGTVGGGGCPCLLTQVIMQPLHVHLIENLLEIAFI